MLSDILDYLKKNREASGSEIAVLLKMDRQLVEDALDELIKKRRVERNMIKHVSCGGCGGACSSSSCIDKEIFRYIDTYRNSKHELAS